MISLQRLLGHKFDGLVNEDRPDLQSADRCTLGIEVTRAMEQGKNVAQQMLKDLAGISATGPERDEFSSIVRSGYGFGLQEGRYVGGLELDYWSTAKPLRDIIASKVGKVTSGFYGNFREFGLFVFSKEPLTEAHVARAIRYTMGLQRDAISKYARLYLSDADHLYACNLEDALSFDYRITEIEVDAQTRRELYFEALEY